MVATLIGLVLIIAVAVVVMVAVALPRLRGGDELLTVQGRQSIARASQLTRETSISAAENTASAVTSLRDRMSSAWAPASDFLHQQMDRLEAGGTRSAAAEAGSAMVGPQRPLPAISGPIPEIDEPADSSDAGTQQAGGTSELSFADPAVISLRDPGLDETRPQPRIR